MTLTLLLCIKIIRSCFRRIILNRLKGAVNITKTSMMGLKRKNFSLLKVSFCSTNHNRVIVAARVSRDIKIILLENRNRSLHTHYCFLRTTH